MLLYFSDAELLLLWVLCHDCEDEQKRLVSRYARYMIHLPDTDYAQKYAMAQARLSCTMALKERLSQEILMRDLMRTYRLVDETNRK